VSKVLIKAQTDLTQYGMFPGYNFNEGRLSDEEQRFNIDRAVDEMNDVDSPKHIYEDIAYDPLNAKSEMESSIVRARQQAMRNLLEGQTRDYKDYNQLLDDILDHETASGVTVGNMALPESLRQYYSRQETLPEHAPNMHSENWQMPDGSIRPGAIAPINALKNMSTDDIHTMMQGAGLLPMYNPGLQDFERRFIPSLYQMDFSDLPYEDNLPLLHPSKATNAFHQENEGRNAPSMVNRNKLGAWVTASNYADLSDAQQENQKVSINTPSGVVAIRGLNVRDDNMQARPPRGNPQEKINEAVVQSRIPPNRLVPIRHRIDSITNRQTPTHEGYNYPSKSKILEALLGFNKKDPVYDWIRSLPLTRYPEQFTPAFNQQGDVISSSGKVDDAHSGTFRDVKGSPLYQNITPPSWGLNPEVLEKLPPKVIQAMAQQLQRNLRNNQEPLLPFDDTPTHENIMSLKNAEKLLPYFE